MRGNPVNITIILPSLNPDEKLNQVVDGLLREGFSVIVIVNDGSDREHLAPFLQAAEHKEVTVLTHEVNKGKGRALKTAFAYVLQHRPDTAGVVTVDGDNQHASHDIRACAEKLLAEKDKVILGCRDFDQPHVPSRSRFGNRLTRNTFRLLCGIKVSDTQTGLRGIPAAFLPLMCETRGERFEYETEMFFTCQKNNIQFAEVMIDTVYIEDNASSHFHPIRDSLKIYRMILQFAFSSLSSFLLDYGLFTLLLLLLGNSTERTLRLFIATFGARLVSSLYNYTVNKKVVFRSQASTGMSLLKYYTLCALQGAISYGLLYLCSSLLQAGAGLEAVLKLAVDMILFFISFRIQQRWVFR